MKTVAIYEKTGNGMLRLGTFTPRKYYSVRSISEQFCDKHPNADPKALFIARRVQSFGKVVDDAERIPFDCGTYTVSWDNGHDCGDFSMVFHSERAAELWAEEWKRGMVQIEPTEYARREARRVYQWEVNEVEPDPEVDPEAAPDNPRPLWA